jgi:hypothetical protein
METIFIGIPAFNEEDVHITIRTALGKAKSPKRVHIGIVLHYPNGDYPDLTMYPNVEVIAIDDKVGLGTGLTRDLACSLYKGEDYYLQIDAHTVFKPNWDEILIKNYKELKKTVDKPIISTYVPYWYRDRKTGQPLTMFGTADFDAPCETMWSLVVKGNPRALGMEDPERYREFTYGIEGIESPAACVADFSKSNYEEQYVFAGHFMFTTAKYLEEVPFDPLTTYHEENSYPMRAWTRGYRIFNMKDHALWTREMYTKGRDVPNSWKSTIEIKHEDGVSFRDKVTEGTLRNKDILTGKVLGIWGAPTQELLDEYEKASGINYKEIYKKMYEAVEEFGDKYPAAKNLYDLEKQREREQADS